MNGLRFIPLGVGDAFSARWYSSCLALEADGAWLLVDCPHPIRKMMREAGATAGVDLDVDRLLGVVVTHLHADHASGLEGLGYFSHFALRRPATLLAHPDVARRLWEGHLAAGMEQLLPAVGASPRPMAQDDYFAWTPLDVDRPVTLGPFRIECRPTIHHIPTTALRIAAVGRSLGYSADTAFDPTLIEWLAAADLIVHETNLGVHTPYADLAALPAALRARMRLIHYPDGFDRAASVIEPLEQGRRYEV
ncbi:MAG: ribonuclease Z [Planctomycetes bacterium]|nr:ribonuclease Z [Planctomycetota bacterium]